MSELDFAGISFDDAEKAMDEKPDYTPIPDGDYEVKVSNVEITESQYKTKGVKVTFDCIAPNFLKKKVFKTFWIESRNGKTRQLLGMISGFLNSCGVDKQQRELLYKSGFAPSAVHSALSEKIYTIRVGHRDHEGKTYNEFDSVLSVKQAGATF